MKLISRIYEGIGQTNEIRPIYMKCLRTTSIHNEIESESVLMNILLRNYMHSNLLDQGMLVKLFATLYAIEIAFSNVKSRKTGFEKSVSRKCEQQ